MPAAKVAPGICLSGHSALEYWRAATRPPSAHEWVANPGEALREPPRMAYLNELDERWQQTLRIPLDIAVGNRSLRRIMRLAHTRLCEAALPTTALVRAGRGLYVFSPEMCYLQMSEVLDPDELVLLGFELCGTYAPPRPGASGLVQRSQPLTSIAQIKTTLGSIPTARYRTKALAAVGRVLERSASPMESISAMLLATPRRRGGFGLPAPLLNHRVDFDDAARTIAHRSYARADLYWPRARVDVEYEGRSYHEGSMHMAADKARANALAHMGVTTISLFNEHLQSDSLLHDMAREVARAIGFRFRPTDYEDRERRLALRRTILRRVEGSAEPRWPGLREEEPTLAEALEERR